MVDELDHYSNNVQCPFSANGYKDANQMKMLVGMKPNADSQYGEEGKSELSIFTEKQETLIIIDPYFFTIPQYRKEDTILKVTNIVNIKIV